jgi:hypothetical protein
MTKPVYSVKVVQKGREAEYLDAMAQPQAQRQEASGQSSGSLFFTEQVRASNKREAVMLVRKRYPDHQVLDQPEVVSPGSRPTARRS